MATTLLYHRDPLLLDFNATVVSLAVRDDGKLDVVLEETAFYPEAGGQMADRGSLAFSAVKTESGFEAGTFDVVDVQVDDAGLVHHVLAGATDRRARQEGVSPGKKIRGVVDVKRRRQHMAMHTAQHMLSRALIDVANAETVSARLGETVCTVDVQVPALVEKKLVEAEALVNGVIDDDVAIRAWFPTADELAALPLRRKPKVDENIRVVAVGDAGAWFDVSPCGGTHCLRTSQIGLVRVVGVEKYKGMTRIHFQAGPRARAEAFERARMLESLARDFSSAPADVPAQIEKLKQQIKGARDDRSLLVDKLAALVALDLATRANDDAVVATIEGDVDLLRAVASRIVDGGKDALLAVKTADGTQVVLARASTSKRDCGAQLKRIATAAGGRGGGKAERAEGRLPVDADWRALVEQNA